MFPFEDGGPGDLGGFSRERERYPGRRLNISRSLSLGPGRNSLDPTPSWSRTHFGNREPRLAP